MVHRERRPQPGPRHPAGNPARLSRPLRHLLGAGQRRGDRGHRTGTGRGRQSGLDRNAVGHRGRPHRRPGAASRQRSSPSSVRAQGGPRPPKSSSPSTIAPALRPRTRPAGPARGAGGRTPGPVGCRTSADPPSGRVTAVFRGGRHRRPSIACGRLGHRRSPRTRSTLAGPTDPLAPHLPVVPGRAHLTRRDN